MPIYEFICRACSGTFERLLRSEARDTTRPPCPSCGAADVERMLSSFAVSSEGTRQANLAHGKERASKAFAEKRDADYKSYIDHVSDH